MIHAEPLQYLLSVLPLTLVPSKVDRGSLCFDGQGSQKHMLRAVEAMKAGDCKPSDMMYAALFTAIGMGMLREGADRRGELRGIGALRRQMQERKIVHSSTSLHAQVWALGEGGDIDKVMGCIRWARRQKDHYRWPLMNVLIYNTAMHACCRHGKMEEMNLLVDMMRADGCLRDIASDNSLRNECTYADADLPSALLILKTLDASGRSPDLFMFNFLIQVVGHAGDLTAGVSLLSRMERQGIQPDRDTLRTLLFYAARHGRLKVMEQMVERMQREGLAPDTDVILAVVAAFAKAGRRTQALEAMEKFQTRMLGGHASASLESNLDAHSHPAEAYEFPSVLNFERLRELVERGETG